MPAFRGSFRRSGSGKEIESAVQSFEAIDWDKSQVVEWVLRPDGPVREQGFDDAQVGAIVAAMWEQEIDGDALLDYTVELIKADFDLPTGKANRLFKAIETLKSGGHKPKKGTVFKSVFAMANPQKSLQKAVDQHHGGRWKLGLILGQGSGGIVFSVKDTRLVDVALKFRDTPDKDAIRKAHREVAAMQRVSHPNVCTVHDSFLLKGIGVFCMVLEHMNSGSLDRYLANTPSGKLEQREVVRIGYALLKVRNSGIFFCFR